MRAERQRQKGREKEGANAQAGDVVDEGKEMKEESLDGERNPDGSGPVAASSFRVTLPVILFS